MSDAARKPKRDQLRPGEVLCDYCTAKCCRYFAVAIKTPKKRADFDVIRWYLLHDGATLFTEDGRWYVLVHAVCKHLAADNRCRIYETRPQVCRDYTTENCEYDEDAVYDRYFETPEQLEEYAEALFPPAAGVRSPPPPLLPVIG
jgi:Fe-S-cluster containining protein